MKRLNLFLGAAALAAICLAASPAANAQENGNRDENGKIVRGPYETNRFGDNWFIGVAGGINVFWNEGYDNLRISPSLDANFGKWFTPSVGMRAGYQGLYAQVWSPIATTLGPTLDTEKNMYLEKFGYMYIHGDFLWNISNAFSGYKETRFWDFVPYLHAGYFRTYAMDEGTFASNQLAAGVGLLHNLRLANRLDLIIDMRATAVDGIVHGADGLAILPSVTMGLAVDLGWPNFVRSSTIIAAVEAASLDQIAAMEAAAVALEMANIALQEENADLEKANSKLSKEVTKLKNAQPAFNAEKFFGEMGPATVYFEIGKTVLNDKEMQHFDFIAKNIVEQVSEQTKIYITVLGTADSNTGTKQRNQYLSKARGEYIYNILTTKYGIAPDRLVVQSKVLSDKAHPDLERAVTITF